jgi:thiamine-phosphate pyrophosphorylase
VDERLHLLGSTEQVDTARIMDVSADRAREALRVVEDYCRFVLDDAFLSRELKQLRHELTEALAPWSTTQLLEARETRRDVGTTISTPGEEHRPSLQAVVEANFKRLQESLRSLEEFGKVQSPQLGQTVEQLRYRCYTLERALILGAWARQRLADVRLCVLISTSYCKAALDWTIKEAAAGGARMIQLREKSLKDRALLELARQIRRWTREAGVLFIVNDRADVARLAEADGVHVGQEDLPLKESRRILGPDLLIGVSTHTIGQVRQAILDGANYVGVGPTFPSETKEFAEFPGLEFVSQVSKETSLPAFVIGGVSQENIERTTAAGGQRIAVGQAVCQSPNPRRAAEELLQALPQSFSRSPRGP